LIQSRARYIRDLQKSAVAGCSPIKLVNLQKSDLQVAASCHKGHLEQLWVVANVIEILAFATARLQLMLQPAEALVLTVSK
jgi:hypothetical protein